MALTPNTNSLNSGGYLPVTEFLKRCDQRTVADLVSDTGVKVTIGSLSSDPNLAACLLDASGFFEAAITTGQRYAPSDIANLLALPGATAPATVPNAGQGLVYRVLATLTEAMLWDRRPEKGPPPQRLAWIEGFMAKLSNGEAILPFKEAQAAGVMEDVIEQDTDVTARNLTVTQAERMFGRRGNRWGPGPPSGLPSGTGWWGW